MYFSVSINPSLVIAVIYIHSIHDIILFFKETENLYVQQNRYTGKQK